jgi:hypothetical protein
VDSGATSDLSSCIDSRSKLAVLCRLDTTPR